MVKVLVTGIGLLSCLGNLQETWYKISQFKSGIKKYRIFPEFPNLTLGLIGKNTINLDTLTKIVLEETLKNANLKPPLFDCGIAIGSSRSYQSSLESFATQLYHQNSPFLIRENNIDWLQTLPSQPAQLTANILQTKAPVFANSTACSTGIWAIAEGYELIKQGICNKCLVGAVETPITKLTVAGFKKIGALAKKGCYPFDQDRDGFVLAEGGAMLMLESLESAKRRNAFIYGEISGVGRSCDAHHFTQPEPTGKTAIWAIKQCLQQSLLIPADIDYIHAHGTGTLLNDCREAKIINTLFSDSVAVSSTKGATGHTLGASGAIATGLSLMAIKYQQLPPNIGLKKSEFNLNLVRKKVDFSINNVLCFNFGFGGQNAILALKKVN